MRAGPQNSPLPPSPPAPQWNVIITEWALDSYLNLKHAQVFTDHEYWNVLRPDVELLKDGIPSPTRSSSFPPSGYPLHAPRLA